MALLVVFKQGTDQGCPCLSWNLVGTAKVAKYLRNTEISKKEEEEYFRQEKWNG